MWFTNATIYHYKLNDAMDFTPALAEDCLKPCPAHARFIYGWLPASGDELIHEVSGCSLVCLGKEERVLPRGVIKHLLSERIHSLETQQGRTIKRAEKAQLAEDLEFELLPKSFCLQKRLPAIFDKLSQRLIINTSSPNQAAQLIALLRKSFKEIQLEPISLNENLALRFAQWLSNPNLLPPNFQLASDCLLFCMNNEKKRINCKGYDLPAEEIVTLLSQGLAAAEISLIWNERIQFTLNESFIFKRLKCLDYLNDEFASIKEMEEAYQQQDAELVLMTGELRNLIDDLLASLTSTTEQNLNAVEMNGVLAGEPI